MPMTDMTDRRNVLEARLAELRRRLNGIEDELDSHQARDWEEMATEREDEEVLEGLGQSGQVEMRMIKAALARMDAGEYGFCARCGEAIQPERLDVVPYTPLCRTCAGATAKG